VSVLAAALAGFALSSPVLVAATVALWAALRIP
jgi:hypothetical protein